MPADARTGDPAPNHPSEGPDTSQGRTGHRCRPPTPRAGRAWLCWVCGQAWVVVDLGDGGPAYTWEHADSPLG